jgi:hypothetical protein
MRTQTICAVVEKLPLQGMSEARERSRIELAHQDFDWKPKTSRVVTGLEIISALILIFGGLMIISGIRGLITTPQDSMPVMALLVGLSISISGFLVYSLSIMIRTLFTMERHLQYMENLATIIVERIEGLQ